MVDDKHRDQDGRDEFDSRARRAADAVKRGVAESPAATHSYDGTSVIDDARARTRRRHVAGVASAVSLLLLATGSFGAVQFSAARDKQKHGGAQTAQVERVSHQTPFALAGDLKPFTACEDTLQYFKTHAYDFYVNTASGARGANEGVVPDTATSPFARQGEAGSRALRAQADGTAPGSDSPESASADASTNTPQFSQTNIQERGVDEPDVVKTDGRRVFVVARGTVRVLDVNNGVPTLRSTLGVKNVESVLLYRDALAVFSSAANVNDIQPLPAPAPALTPEPMPASVGVPEKTRVTIYNVSDMAKPQAVQTLEVDGRMLDARMNGSVVRVATSFTPDLNIPSPRYTREGKLTDGSKQTVRDAIEKSTIAHWIPSYRLVEGEVTASDAGTQSAGTEPSIACDRIARPSRFSGLSTLGVMSFSMTDDLKDFSSVGVVATGDSIYANDKSFYIASAKWNADDSPLANTEPATAVLRTPAGSTELHKFSVVADDNKQLAMVYRGSGSVDGTLLNSYSMSERDDVLRVATTSRGSTGWIRPQTRTFGNVFTLKTTDGKLEQIARIGDLGAKDNESIKAVRFLDDKAYVVTFRQTDPLFLIDLRDPAAPKIAGELKIPGYSGYLHPIGKDRILGVGMGTLEDETPSPTNTVVRDGSIRPSTTPALQFRLFDVADPAHPKLVDTRMYREGAADVLFDARAFLYWEPRNLVIVPAQYFDGPRDVQKQRRGEFEAPFRGLLMLLPKADALSEAGRIAYAGKPEFENVKRTMVIGEHVFALSETGLQSNSLDTHKLVGSVTFSS